MFRATLRQFHKALFGLQFRTTVLAMCIVLAATGLTGALYLRISARLAVDEAKRHTRDMAKTLAAVSADPITQHDRAALLEIAESSMKQGELTYVIFTDMAGNILASLQCGRDNMTHLIRKDGRQVSVAPINQPRLTNQGESGPQVDVVYPIAAAAMRPSGAAPPATAGYVRLGLSLAGTESRLSSVVRSVFGLAVGIALLMVPLGYEVVRNLIRPINQLAEAARTIAAGDLSVRVPVRGRDEVSDLSRTFNAMADDLARSHNDLVKLNAELEDRVLHRTEELEQVNTKLREMAARDSLTGLYNRRQFRDLLSRLFSESQRYKTDLTCMMLDLDNFKRVNDSLGHQVGDALLQLTADVIRESIRESDVAVRYGGDEFVVMLPRTSPADARTSAQRMLGNFRRHLLERMPEASITSLSIGLASREEDEPSSAMSLVNLADEALYLAKAGGKDRITVVRPVMVEHGVS